MRKITALFLAMTLIITMAAPAMAELNLGVNGRDYSTATPVYLSDGISGASLEVIEQILGATAVEDGDTITVYENGNVLVMTIGSTEVLFNGESKTLAAAPIRQGDEVFVPVRSLLEIFGANIHWNDLTQSIEVDYTETRESQSASDILLKAEEQMRALNTCKMQVNSDSQISILIPAISSKEHTMNLDSTINGWLSNEPLGIYMKQESKMDALQGLPGSSELDPIVMETFISKDGMFMTVPGQSGWYKMDLDGLDISEIINDGSNNPVANLANLEKTGMVISLGNDDYRNGQPYWVIEVVADEESIKKELASLGKFLPQTDNIDEIMKALKFNVLYKIYVNQNSGLVELMDLEMDMAADMSGIEENSGSMSMKMTMKAEYTLSDYGVEVSFPDVSNARDMDDMMADLAQ